MPRCLSLVLKKRGIAFELTAVVESGDMSIHAAVLVLWARVAFVGGWAGCGPGAGRERVPCRGSEAPD